MEDKQEEEDQGDRIELEQGQRVGNDGFLTLPDDSEEAPVWCAPFPALCVSRVRWEWRRTSKAARFCIGAFGCMMLLCLVAAVAINATKEGPDDVTPPPDTPPGTGPPPSTTGMPRLQPTDSWTEVFELRHVSTSARFVVFRSLHGVTMAIYAGTKLSHVHHWDDEGHQIRWPDGACADSNDASLPRLDWIHEGRALIPPDFVLTRLPQLLYDPDEADARHLPACVDDFKALNATDPNGSPANLLEDIKPVLAEELSRDLRIVYGADGPPASVVRSFLNYIYFDMVTTHFVTTAAYEARIVTGTAPSMYHAIRTATGWPDLMAANDFKQCLAAAVDPAPVECVDAVPCGCVRDAFWALTSPMRACPNQICTDGSRTGCDCWVRARIIAQVCLLGVVVEDPSADPFRRADAPRDAVF